VIPDDLRLANSKGLGIASPQALEVEGRRSRRLAGPQARGPAIPRDLAAAGAMERPGIPGWEASGRASSGAGESPGSAASLQSHGPASPEGQGAQGLWCREPASLRNRTPWGPRNYGPGSLRFQGLVIPDDLRLANSKGLGIASPQALEVEGRRFRRPASSGTRDTPGPGGSRHNEAAGAPRMGGLRPCVERGRGVGLAIAAGQKPTASDDHLSRNYWPPPARLVSESAGIASSS
jgi:hypothetical protein